jgi:hypothetical protein
MQILGLDQSPKGIGWAYGQPGEVPTRGYRPNPDYGDNTARLRKSVREWLVTFGKSIGVERIYFEQILVRDTKKGLHMPTLHKQFAVVGGIETAAEQLGLEDDCYETLIADWRREFYAGSRPTKGQGSSSDAWKDMALQECLRRGWLIDNHNIAEACGVWDYGCKHSDKIYRVRAGVTKRRQQSAADEARRAGL